MLEMLDAIDWSKVANCYGMSDSIPAAIRDLLSDDVNTRREARGILGNLLEHQVTVYQASALSVPFLLEILADARTQDKYPLLQLMVLFGSQGAHLGKYYQSLPERIALQSMKERPTNERIREMERDLAIWKKETHEAFRKGLPLFLTMLADADSAIRKELPLLLGALKEDHALLIPALMTQLQAEKDEYVQCSLLLCLGELSVPGEEVSQLLEHYLMTGETALLQFVAARALCTLLKEETPEHAVHLLLDVLVDSSTLQPAYEQFFPYWGNNGADAIALYHLDQLTSSPYQELIIHRLVEIFPILDSYRDLDCADILLRVTFYEKNFQFQQDMIFDDLDFMQQVVLQTIVSKEAFWAEPPPLIWSEEDFGERSTPFGFKFHQELNLTPNPKSVQTLVSLGLPSTLQGLRAFIRKGEKPDDPRKT